LIRGIRIAAIARALLGAPLGVLLAASSAGAAVTQPDATPLPQPTPSTEISLVTSRGFSADADTLVGLFKYFAGGADAAIDPINDAATTPGIFPAECGFKVQIVLKGGACKNAFGWYNATIPSTTPSAIYPLVPAALTAAPPNGIGCLDGDFCPLASRTTSQAPQHAWADPLPAFSVDLRSNPNWAGGPVGFALVANSSGGQCSQTKYTQADLNAKSSTGVPWITALVYHSKADADGYYLAFEDLPMCAASWRGCMGGTTQALPPGSGNDGDFNDDVFYVTGLDCSLAGGTPDGGVDASSSGAAGTTGAGGASNGAAGGGGTTGASGSSGAGAANGSVVDASGTAGDTGSTGTAGAAGGTGASGAAGMTGGAAGIGGMNSFAGASGSAGRTGATGAAGHSPFGTTGVDGTGCGCDLAGPASSWWLGTLLLGGLAIARRRRRAIGIKIDQ
jgi:MYXO-CTERM domain-containing protein